MKKGKQLVRFDWAMKKLLRNKANFGILEGFLSELLSEDIKIRRILESEGNKEEKDDKHNRVDILVEDSTGELIIIEVQNSKEYDYFHRILYGTSKAITENIDSGEAYENVKKVISVTIAYFDLGQGKDYVYHGKTEFRGIHKGDVLNLIEQQLEIYDIGEVQKAYSEYWLVKVHKFDNVVQDRLDEWIYFFKNGVVQEGFSAKGLSEAKKKLDPILLTDDEKSAYKYFLKRLRDIASAERTKIYDTLFDWKDAQKLKEIQKEMKEKIKRLEQTQKKMQEHEKQVRKAIRKRHAIRMNEIGILTDRIAPALRMPEAEVKQILEEYRNS